MIGSHLAWRGQLSHLSLSVPDVDQADSFYRTVVGLSRHPVSPGDRTILGWALGARVLELVPGSPGLDHFAIEIPDARELDALVSRLAANRVATDEISDADHPRGVALLDPEGRKIEFHGPIDRTGERLGDARWRPRRLQHLTLASKTLEDTLAFYTDVLGMRLSDRMGDVFAWLRCGTEHHTIAIVASDNPTSIDHFSFDLDGWSDFKVWCDRLSELEVAVAWGPGRHGPGDNLFIMFDDPHGFHIELSAEMEHYFDELTDQAPRIWKADTSTVNLWGGVPAWRAGQVA